MVTCSSAAGTAMATGFKTNNSMLGVAPDSTDLTAITYKIHDAGYAVGVTSNVQVNHATPACFYGHSVKRSDYYSIGEELPLTGFEFFAGGGFIQPWGKENEKEKSLYQIAEEGGYTIACGLDEFNEKKSADKFLLVKEKDSDDICDYALGRKEGSLSLPQIVSAAIEVLERNPKGFFLMAEGGLIDWTAHSNDLAGTVFEILDFDEAISVAYEFYKKHPEQTLIVVTADHETGGPALGGKGRKIDLTVIDSISTSATTSEVEEYLNNKTVMSELTEKANIGWTTTSHCGGPVPVWAIGAGSEKFAARQDNTDIAKKICSAMGIAF
jgi:Alkaline phosphatase